MGAPLLKSETVMDFMPEFDLPGLPVTFVAKDDDTGGAEKMITILRGDWDDFGQPEQITVTIQPGDRLNP